MGERLVLVGMLDSPFVRRVAIALELAHVPYENLPLRTFGDAAQFAAYSPLKRAPTLVLEDGEPLFDSHIILTYLIERFEGVRALLPAEPAERLRCLQVTGAATGLADKAVSTIYEKLFHPGDPHDSVLLTRARRQFDDTLRWLEERAPATGWLSQCGLSLADISLGTAVCFLAEAHPDLVTLSSFLKVTAWYARLAALPVFKKTYLRLDPPKPRT